MTAHANEPATHPAPVPAAGSDPEPTPDMAAGALQEPSNCAAYPGARRLLLLGTGFAHLQVLQSLASQPLAGVHISLISAHDSIWRPSGLADFVAGHRTAEQCQWPLETLIRRSGVHWHRASVRALDAHARTATLDDGQCLHFDWLSINTGGLQNREAIEARLPGAREHAVFLQPLAGFATVWPQVCALAQTRVLRCTVIGGGVVGLELALAVQRRMPQAAVTLVTGGAALGARYPAGLQQSLARIFRARNITVLPDRAVAISADAVGLASGAALASDVSIIATGPQPPRSVSHSGLALDAYGRIAVDAGGRSSSHPMVFASGEISSSAWPHPPRTVAAGLAAGRVLALNLRDAVSLEGDAARSVTPPAAPKLQAAGNAHAAQAVAGAAVAISINCANHTALGYWRNWSAQGRWVLWLARWQESRALATLPDPAKDATAQA